MARLGGVDTDSTREIVDTAFTQVYLENSEITPLASRSKEAFMQDKPKAKFSIDTSDYSTEHQTFTRNDSDPWQFATENEFSTDSVELDWTQVRRWGRKFSPDQVTDTVPDIVAQQAVRQAISVSNVQDLALLNGVSARQSLGSVAHDGLLNFDISAVKPNRTGTPRDQAAPRTSATAGGYNFGTAGANYLDMATARMSGASADAATPWNMMLTADLTFSRAHLKGKSARNPQEWMAIVPPEFARALSLYALDKGSDMIRDKVLSTGQSFPSIFDIAIVETTRLNESTRSWTNASRHDLDEAASGGSNKRAIPVIFMARRACEYGERFQMTQIKQPGESTDWLFHWQSMFNYYFQLFEPELLWRFWLFTE